MKIWRLFIPIIIITFFLYLIFSGINESFTSSSNVIFKSKEEIQLFIINDRDDYIKNMSIYDLRARKVKSHEEYINIIVTNILDFNSNQKEKLIRCSKKASNYFNNGKDWKFALISSVYEEGFPHTREDIIFLSPSVLNYDDNNLTKTLIHESIHIYQRYNKMAMKEYMIKNGFEMIRRREKGGLIRSNPDLDDFIYKKKNGIEMIATYNSEYPNGIGDIKISSHLEHPFEYMAYEMAEEYYKSLMNKYKEL
jgi:hypothetical protein